MSAKLPPSASGDRERGGAGRCGSPPSASGVVVGVGGSPRSAVAVSWAAREAELRNATLTLVHATRRPSLRRARQILDDALAVADENCRAGGPPEVLTKVALGDPVASLVDLSRNAELVVVGARRRALRGSVSSDVLHRSHCAVAVIHDEDPLMPHPAQAPVLVGVGGPAGSRRAAVRAARREASGRGVSLIEVPMSGSSTRRLVERSESAQLVVVSDWAAGEAVAQSARMPVIVAR